MAEVAPLFPLGTVLLPGLPLPLHVFEERYRRLVVDLLALPHDARRFGVVAIRAGRETGPVAPELYDVGCVAGVREIAERADGRYHLTTTGEDRFRLLDVDTSRPYLRGRVQRLGEPVGDDPDLARRLARAVAAALREYLPELRRLHVGATGLARLPVEPVPLSYVAAAAVVVDLPDRQRLLAADDATARLRDVLGLLHRETALLRLLSAPAAPDLARGLVSPN
ncbi:MAG TPA: LON peptidase substrate-binding domain-containing protein [Mycobacteriales bacterium]|nr:LON peptidase substrate-binding domain-containing protein [Mycobacteriales bacterium]